ncbi:PAS domain S-box protein, partial [bacterium]|nr:PAS domain S-box protein [bacterium]
MQSLSVQQSKWLIEALNEHATVAMTNFDGELLYVNQKFCEISGYSEEELIGKNPNILNSSFHSSQFFGNLWTSIKSGNTWQGEIRNQKKNGSIYFTNTTIVPFLSDNLKDTHFVAILNDISDRVFAEKSTQHLNGILEAVIEGSPFAIIGLDCKYKIKIWNKSASKLLGVDQSKMPGQDFREYFSSFPDFHRILFQEDSFSNSEFEFNIHLNQRDLSFSRASLDYSMVDEDEGILLMVKDVTNQRNMEREILSISDREQLRIGHDLHDVLGQDLTGIQLKLKLLDSHLGKANSELRQEIDSIAADFKSATSFVRDFAESLDPLKVEHLGIEYALNNFAESISSRFKFPCNFTCDFDPDFSKEVSMQLYRITSEADMNA